MNEQSSISAFDAEEDTRTALLFPNGVRELLGPAPLLFGESEDNYERILARFAADVCPKDFVEWVLVKDIADCTWEIQRLLRFEAEVVRRGIASATRDKLTSLMPLLLEPNEQKSSMKVQEMAERALLGDCGSEAQLDTLLKRTGLSREILNTESYIKQLWALRPLQEIRAKADLKRERLLRLIELRRTALGNRLRRASDATIADVEAELSK